jgi:hypothetical protein
MTKFSPNLATILTLLFMTGAAQAQTPTFKQFMKEPAFVVKMTGTGLDMTSSALLIDGIYYREGNRLFATRSGKLNLPANIAFSAGVTYIEYRVWKRNRKLGITMMFVDGFARGMLGARSFYLLRGKP